MSNTTVTQLDTIGSRQFQVFGNEDMNLNIGSMGTSARLTVGEGQHQIQIGHIGAGSTLTLGNGSADLTAGQMDGGTLNLGHGSYNVTMGEIGTGTNDISINLGSTEDDCLTTLEFTDQVQDYPSYYSYNQTDNNIKAGDGNFKIIGNIGQDYLGSRLSNGSNTTITLGNGDSSIVLNDAGIDSAPSSWSTKETTMRKLYVKGGDGNTSVESELAVKDLDIHLGNGNKVITQSGTVTTGDISLGVGDATATLGNVINRLNISDTGGDTALTTGDISQANINMGDGNLTLNTGQMNAGTITAGDGNHTIKTGELGTGTNDVSINLGNTAGGLTTLEFTDQVQDYPSYYNYNQTDNNIKAGDGNFKIIGNIGQDYLGGRLSNGSNTTITLGDGDSSIVLNDAGIDGAPASWSTKETTMRKLYVKGGDGDISVNNEVNVKDLDIQLGDGNQTISQSGTVQKGDITLGEGAANITIGDVTSALNMTIDPNAPKSLSASAATNPALGNKQIKLGDVTSTQIKVGQGNVNLQAGQIDRGVITAGDGNHSIKTGELGIGDFDVQINLGDGNSCVEFDDKVQGYPRVNRGGDPDINIGDGDHCVVGHIGQDYRGWDLSLGSITTVEVGDGNSTIKMLDAGITDVPNGWNTPETTMRIFEVKGGDGNMTVESEVAVQDFDVHLGDGNQVIAQKGTVTNGDITLGEGKANITLGDVTGRLNITDTGGDTSLTTGDLRSANIKLGDGNLNLRTGQIDVGTITAGDGNHSIKTGELGIGNNDVQINLGNGNSCVEFDDKVQGYPRVNWGGDPDINIGDGDHCVVGHIGQDYRGWDLSLGSITTVEVGDGNSTIKMLDAGITDVPNSWNTPETTMRVFEVKGGDGNMTIESNVAVRDFDVHLGDGSQVVYQTGTVTTGDITLGEGKAKITLGDVANKLTIKDTGGDTSLTTGNVRQAAITLVDGNLNLRTGQIDVGTITAGDGNHSIKTGELGIGNNDVVINLGDGKSCVEFDDKVQGYPRVNWGGDPDINIGDGDHCVIGNIGQDYRGWDLSLGSITTVEVGDGNSTIKMLDAGITDVPSGWNTPETTMRIFEVKGGDGDMTVVGEVAVQNYDVHLGEGSHKITQTGTVTTGDITLGKLEDGSYGTIGETNIKLGNVTSRLNLTTADNDCLLTIETGDIALANLKIGDGDINLTTGQIDRGVITAGDGDHKIKTGELGIGNNDVVINLGDGNSCVEFDDKVQGYPRVNWGGDPDINIGDGDHCVIGHIGQDYRGWDLSLGSITTVEVGDGNSTIKMLDAGITDVPNGWAVPETTMRIFEMKGGDGNMTVVGEAAVQNYDVHLGDGTHSVTQSGTITTGDMTLGKGDADVTLGNVTGTLNLTIDDGKTDLAAGNVQTANIKVGNGGGTATLGNINSARMVFGDGNLVMNTGQIDRGTITVGNGDHDITTGELGIGNNDVIINVGDTSTDGMTYIEFDDKVQGYPRVNWGGDPDINAGDGNFVVVGNIGQDYRGWDLSLGSITTVEVGDGNSIIVMEDCGITDVPKGWNAPETSMRIFKIEAGNGDMVVRGEVAVQDYDVHMGDGHHTVIQQGTVTDGDMTLGNGDSFLFFENINTADFTVGNGNAVVHTGDIGTGNLTFGNGDLKLITGDITRAKIEMGDGNAIMELGQIDVGTIVGGDGNHLIRTGELGIGNNDVIITMGDGMNCIEFDDQIQAYPAVRTGGGDPWITLGDGKHSIIGNIGQDYQGTQLSLGSITTVDLGNGEGVVAMLDAGITDVPRGWTVPDTSMRVLDVDTGDGVFDVLSEVRVQDLDIEMGSGIHEVVLRNDVTTADVSFGAGVSEMVADDFATLNLTKADGEMYLVTENIQRANIKIGDGNHEIKTGQIDVGTIEVGDGNHRILTGELGIANNDVAITVGDGNSCIEFEDRIQDYPVFRRGGGDPAIKGGNGNHSVVGRIGQDYQGTALSLGSITTVNFGHGSSTIAMLDAGITDTPRNWNTPETSMRILQVNTDDGDQKVLSEVRVQDFDMNLGAGDHEIRLDKLITQGDITLGTGDTTLVASDFTNLNFKKVVEEDLDAPPPVDGAAPLVEGDLTLKVGNISNAKIEVGNGDHVVVTENITRANITLGDGNQRIHTGQIDVGTITVGDGDHFIHTGELGIGDNDVVINLGNGNSCIEFDDMIQGYPRINRGGGDPDINAGDGNHYILGHIGQDYMGTALSLGSITTVEVGHGNSIIVMKDAGITDTPRNWNTPDTMMRIFRVDAGDGNTTVRSEVNVTDLDIHMGAGQHAVKLEGDATRVDITLGTGNHNLISEGTMTTANIKVGDGSSQLDLGDSTTMTLTMGHGDQKLSIGDVTSNIRATLGDGDHQISTGTVARGTFTLGDGDHVINAGELGIDNNDVVINAGDGNTCIEFTDQIQAYPVQRTGGGDPDINLGAGNHRVVGYIGQDYLGTSLSVGSITTVELGVGNSLVAMLDEGITDVPRGWNTPQTRMNTLVVDGEAGEHEVLVEVAVNRATIDLAGAGADKLILDGGVANTWRVNTHDGDDVILINSRGMDSGARNAVLDLGEGFDRVVIYGGGDLSDLQIRNAESIEYVDTDLDQTLVDLGLEGIEPKVCEVEDMSFEGVDFAEEPKSLPDAPDIDAPEFELKALNGFEHREVTTEARTPESRNVDLTPPDVNLTPKSSDFEFDEDTVDVSAAKHYVNIGRDMLEEAESEVPPNLLQVEGIEIPNDVIFPELEASAENPEAGAPIDIAELEQNLFAEPELPPAWNLQGESATSPKARFALPKEVRMAVEYGNFRGKDTEDSFNLVTTSLDGQSLTQYFENAYCINYFRPVDVTPISLGDVMGPKSYEANVYRATEAELSRAGIDLGAGDVDGNSAMENLDLINWILNQDFNNQDNGDGEGKNYTDSEIQGAIWALTDGAQLEKNYGSINLEAFGYADGVQVLPGTGTLANATEIIELAQAQGEGFEAGDDDVVGMVIAPKDGDQPFIVGVSLKDDDQLG